jgi:hypothetical protein
MATVTPIYNWPVPTSTDYVKDGATAIESLGDAIDSSLNSITTGKNVGMVHLNTSTFSSAASVSVDNVFTTTYDNYRILFNITAASATNVPLRWYGRTSGSDVTSTYVHQIIIAESGSITGGRYSNSEFAQTSNSYPAFTQGALDLLSPKLSNKTIWETSNFYISNSGLPYRLSYGGYFDGNNSFDGIKLFPTSGTFSGTMRIYGLRNS